MSSKNPTVEVVDGRTKNIYRCPKCLGCIVTVDRDPGVTPMFLSCRAQVDCDGRMVSLMYPVEPWPDKDPSGTPIPTEPTWEWYKPSPRYLKRVIKKARQRGGHWTDELWHITHDGLLLREITK